MPVDMVVSRFLNELRVAVPEPFEREGRYDASFRDHQLPPYRHVFHALCLFEHSAGYHLPRYTSFRQSYLRALMSHPRYQQLLPALLPGNQPSAALHYRIGGWYLDGLAHTHLYCALVQAYEEQRRIGAVLMDARVDAKLKTDIVVVGASACVHIDIRYTSSTAQRSLLHRREQAEKITKSKNSTSSQKNNPFYEHIPSVFINHDNMEFFENTNVKLFSSNAIDLLIQDIDKYLGVSGDNGISYNQMRNLTMSDLQRLEKSGGINSY